MEQHLTLARALTAALGLTAVLAAPVPSFAQTTQASPLPSAEQSSAPAVSMPAADASSAPTAMPTVNPAVEPSAEPSPAHKNSLAKHAVHGVLKSLKGTKAIVKLADGTMQTFNVTSQTAALLKSHLGKNGVYRVIDGVLTLVPAGTPLSP